MLAQFMKRVLVPFSIPNCTNNVAEGTGLGCLPSHNFRCSAELNGKYTS